ncbi:alpha/beta hydrolase [Planctomicrobium piriforme]|uniref:Acetyl esterase/lipase n=1 Tax=Planctomicrobium piriforme TaxID=1576369 RepID=A0A1I3CGT7_9PLAN|nr:alpha/beta hydrolase [Planctomicrobium piriforme]SFH73576.1 Acetyl esterase/lipase [Planctomicrobium piriforme]
MSVPVQLEPAAERFLATVAQQSPPCEGQPEVERQRLEEIQQRAPINPQVEVEHRIIAAGPKRQLSMKIVRPRQSRALLPPILYLHGGAWVYGSFETHGRLVQELCLGAQAAVIFVDYNLSPESTHPTAAAESYAALTWIAENGRQNGLDPSKLTVAGDCVGGHLAASIALRSQQYSGPVIQRQLLFYPVLDPHCDSDSYCQFATGYGLRRDVMQRCWQLSLGNAVEQKTVSDFPLNCSMSQLRRMPPSLIITAEADVARDEGELYSVRLRAAGVPTTQVRFQGTLHDFLMLNPLAHSAATRGAMMLAMNWLREGFASRA